MPRARQTDWADNSVWQSEVTRVHFQAVSPYIWHIGLDRSQIVAKESAPILESIHFASPNASDIPPQQPSASRHSAKKVSNLGEAWMDHVYQRHAPTNSIASATYPTHVRERKPANIRAEGSRDPCCKGHYFPAMELPARRRSDAEANRGIFVSHANSRRTGSKPTREVCRAATPSKPLKPAE